MNIPPEYEKLKELRGLVATVILTGTVESGFARCHEDMRSFHDRNGFVNLEYRQHHAVLVEAGRDGCIEHMLANKYDFCLQIDADATFEPDSLIRILNTAFNVVPDSDAVSAYCNLKSHPHLPTIDSGTGHWEPHFPNKGVLPVMRTGGHFLLTKRSAFEKMGPSPWFRTRVAPRALDILYELDNLANQRLDNKNPFSETDEWQALLDHAKKNPAGGPSSVGEDSAFGDRLRAVGGQLFVDTDIVTGHIAKHVITWKNLRTALQERQRSMELSVGLL